MLRRPLLPPRLGVYRSFWFPLALTDPAALRQVLASYTIHRHIVESIAPGKSLDAVLESNSQVIRSVRERLGTNTECCDWNGLLCAMTAMACHAHLKGDLWQWRNHVQAIRCVLEALGGLDTPTLSIQLRKFIQWIQVIGCYVLDEAPVLAHPLQVSTNTRSGQRCGSLSPSTGGLASTIPLSSDLNPAMEAVMMLTDVQSTSSDPRQAEWDYDSTLHDRINRIVCSLLCCRNMATKNNELDLGEALFRSGALLYLAEFRRQCGDAPVTTSTHVDQLHRLLSQLDGERTPACNPSFELWLTVLGALEAMSMVHKSMFEGRLALLLTHRNFFQVEQLEAELGSIVWQGL